MTKKVPVIELDDVYKSYQLGEVEVPVLRGLSFRVYKGEFVALIGSSGSGKSTAMNIMGCLDTPTKGKVMIDGKNVSSMDDDELARIRGRKIGFVFQQFNLLGALNCKENVMLPLFFRKKEEDDDERVDALLKDVGLAERHDHKPLEMSGGEQQRAAIARALAVKPELVLADEPTGNLDSETGKSVMNILKKLHKNGTTLVIITHDMNVADHAERILRMKDGRLVRDGHKELLN